MEKSSLPADAAALLSLERDRRKRKAHFGTACLPCRQRKVKCSYETPCEKCLERDHPQLCVYDQPSKRSNALHPPKEGDILAASVADASEWERLLTKIDRLEQGILDMRREVKDMVLLSRQEANSTVSVRASSPEHGAVQKPAPEGLHTTADLTGRTVYLGGNSVPAMVVALVEGSDESVQEIAGKSILPIFALDNESAVYPFVDLWGLPFGSTTRIDELCKLIPRDTECLELFRHYRDTAYVLFPGIVNLDQFEWDLTAFLLERSTTVEPDASTEELSGRKVHGKTLHWLGLLFAVLASGCQCSNRGRRERQLASQVYVCCAYECLRIINYFSQSTLIDIQTLLVLGNVLSNNMNAGVAWSLLGLTTRLAQGLGLDHDSPAGTPPEIIHLRAHVWYRIIWQDSLLSISFDRASAILAIDRHNYDLVTPRSPKMSYIDCMRVLTRLGLEIVQKRAENSALFGPQHIMELKGRLDAITEGASDHLREVKLSRSVRDHLEHWNLEMHHSYILSELCRPVLTGPRTKDIAASDLTAVFVASLKGTLNAFLHLQRITSFAKQSWAAVHRSLSSALLLCILGEIRRCETTHKMVEELITVMSDMYSDLGASEVPTPISRSVMVLEKFIKLSASDQQSFSESAAASEVAGAGLVASSPASTSSGISPYSKMNDILWGAGRELPL